MRRSLALTLLLALGTAANMFAIGEARINGKVTDAVTKAPLPDAKVSMTSSKGAGRSFKAEYKVDKDGNYAIFVLDGTLKYDIVYSAPGHTSEVFNEVKLALGDTTKKDVALQPANAAATGEKAKAPTADPRSSHSMKGRTSRTRGRTTRRSRRWKRRSRRSRN